MKSESLKQILAFLTRILEKNDFNEDKQIIQYLFKELEKLEHQLPTDNKLEELQKIVIDLEIKYDDFNDLVYYFDPLYVKIKKTIHEEKVKEISANPISYLKKYGAYILVYNEGKLDQEHLTEQTKAGLNRQNIRSSQIGIKKHLAGKSKKEIILFGLDFFRGYLFLDVHTYTVDEFQKKKLVKWEDKVRALLKKSGTPSQRRPL